MATDASLTLMEAALRGGAVALLAVQAALLLRDARRAPAGLYGALFMVSVAAYVVASAPGLAHHAPAPWLLPIRLVSLGTPAVFWLFARASFDDTFERSWIDAVAWLGLVTVGFLCAHGLVPLICPVYTALELMFVGLAMVQAIRGRSGDLIEERRQFRVVMMLVSAVYIALIVMLDTTRVPLETPPLSTINAAGLLAVIVAALTQRLALRPRAEFAAPDPALRPSTVPDPPPPPAIDDQERALLERLRRLMEVDKVYREEGLGIAALAAKLGIPEYRLRRLINQCLGHRNFASFVNGYRLADAMAALADRSQIEVPIVTIALDAGFQSLGPFNRAFKAQTGMTPTDYRRQFAGEAPPVAPRGLADSEIG